MSAIRPVSLVPSEIQDDVIDQLHSDLRSLSMCSLVCKQWLVRARHLSLSDREARIFVSSETLDSFYQKRATDRFIELLNTPHSTIPPFIQHLYICGPDISHEVPDVTGPQDHYDLLNTLIINNFPLLLGTRSITISSLTWRCLQPAARAAIGALPRMDSILWDSTVFHCLSELLAFSNTSYPTLEKLKIRQFRVSESDLSTGHACHVLAGQPNAFSRVHFLDVVVESVLHPLLSFPPSLFIRPQNIETLCLIGVPEEDFTLVGSFIEAAGSTLRHLALDVRKSTTDPISENSVSAVFSISLNRNTNLETLEISPIVVLPGRPCETSWLQAIISSLTSPSLKNVTVWFQMTPGPIDPFDFWSFEQSLLRAQLAGVPALERVRVKFIHTAWWEEDDRRRLEEDVNRLLPELRARGMLDLCVLDPPPGDEFDEWAPNNW